MHNLNEVTGKELSKEFLPKHLANEIQKKKKKLNRTSLSSVWDWQINLFQDMTFQKLL